MFGGIIESPHLLQFRNAFLNEVFTRVARMSVNLSSESDYTRSVWFLICRYVPVTCNLKSEVWSTFSSDRVCGWKVILENTFGFQLVPNNFLFHTISAHTTKKDWVSFNRLTELSWSCNIIMKLGINFSKTQMFHTKRTTNSAPKTNIILKRMTGALDIHHLQMQNRKGGAHLSTLENVRQTRFVAHTLTNTAKWFVCVCVWMFTIGFSIFLNFPCRQEFARRTWKKKLHREMGYYLIIWTELRMVSFD